MVSASEMSNSPDVSVIVCGGMKTMGLKAMTSAPAFLLAATIASRKVPSPLSAALVTVNVVGTARSSRQFRLKRAGRRRRGNDLDRNMGFSDSGCGLVLTHSSYRGCDSG